jgi:guanylate kinase
MKDTHHFDFVIPNHDEEDSEYWNAFYYPIGDARNTLLSVKDIKSDNSSNRLKTVKRIY